MSRPVLKLARVTAPDAKRIKQAVRLFRFDLAPRSVRRHNARAWLKSVAMLGEKWKLATPMRLEKRA
jgi:hypothetical protein